MINANEIMVGCWVNPNCPRQVKFICEYFIVLERKSNVKPDLIKVKPYNVNPIPITEEILVKAGDIKWLLSDCEGYYVLINNKKIRIKFMHSLQNLYLCIEQKELDICL